MTAPSQDAFSSPPTALVVDRPRRFSLAWFLPLAALALAFWLALEARAGAGLSITVRAADGHGIDAGDAVRYRGIEVGIVDSVSLSTGLDEVVMDLLLEPFAAGLAREGTDFWVARPQLALEYVAGLETLFGSRYLAVLAGPFGAAPQRSFTALESPPVSESYDEAGLQLVLEAPSRFGLAPGAPLLHRGVDVGRIVAVELAADAARVEVHVFVRPQFTPLIRANTRFWEVGGAEISAGLTSGLHLNVESLRSLLVGGVAFGTPDDPGSVVEDGHRFPLAAEPAEDAADWRPALGVGLGLGSDSSGGQPDVHSLRMLWTEGRVFKSEEQVRGWGIVHAGELIAPRGLLLAHDSAREDSTQWFLDGEPQPLPGEPLRTRGALVAVALPAVLSGEQVTLHARSLELPEACMVIADPQEPPIALDASRLEVVDGGWRVDEQLSVTPAWNGAPVVARADGALLGLLVVGDEVLIVPLP